MRPVRTGTTTVTRIAIGLVLVVVAGACSQQPSFLVPIYRMWQDGSTVLVLTDHDSRPNPCRSFELAFETTNPDEVLVMLNARPIGERLCSVQCTGGGTVVSAEIPEGVEFAQLKRHPDTPPGDQSECVLGLVH